MAQTKVISLILASALLAGCSAPRYTWEKYAMDGHRTGVTAPNSENADEALGSLDGGVYTAPNGTLYSDGSTPLSAASMIEAQKVMAPLMEVVGHSTRVMKKHGPESELSNWTVDLIMAACEKYCGVKADVGITNFGGIRCDMPQGDVLVDDLKSMFPFNNYLAIVYIKGSDLLKVFDFFAKTMPQCVGGVKFVARNGNVEQLDIQGEPIDLEKTYVLATIDFLLDGGDHLNLARDAQKLELTDCKVMDVVEAYVRDLTAKGLPVEYHTDGRVVFEPLKK